MTILKIFSVGALFPTDFQDDEGIVPYSSGRGQAPSLRLCGNLPPEKHGINSATKIVKAGKVL